MNYIHIFKNKEMKSIFVSLFFFIALLVLHLPFLEADPSLELGNLSRDALSDEGLNTSQVNNFVNYSDFGIAENNNLIKSPVFDALILPISYFSGNSLFYIRFFLVICLSVVILISLKKLQINLKGYVMFFTLLFNFYIFQYFHFSMTESLAAFTTFFALIFFSNYFKEFQLKYLIWGSIALFLVFLLKVQFVYIYFVPVVFIYLLYRSEYKFKKKHILLFLTLNFSLFTFYFLCWILPNWELVKIVLQQEVSDRIMHPRFWTTQAFKQFKYFMLDKRTIVLSLFLLLSVIYFLFKTRKEKSSKFYNLSVLNLAWVFIECHKFFIWYVPPRYMLSFYVSISFFIFIQLLVFFEIRHHFINKIFVYVVLFIMFLTNILVYKNSYLERTFVIKNENEWFKKQVNKGDLVAGVWSCILAKESKAKLIPVWKGFFNDKFLLKRYNPKIIVSEWNEEDSGLAFSSQNLDLKKMCKERHFIQYGKYKIVAYILK
jgi:hypothetical protein